MTNEYTKGPWAMSADGVPEAFRPQVTIYSESDGRRVATVFESEGNARLMAAAPDLLEALSALVSVAVENLPSTVHPEIGAAFQAINKAEGR